MSTKLNILFCVESGPLEQQALLLIASVNRWFKFKDYQLVAYSPRIDHQPSDYTLARFVQSGVRWISADINKDFGDYPIANKILACNHFIENNPEANNVMFVDTDTIFLNDIESRMLSVHSQLYLRPVDNKGPGSESVNDVNDEFWKKVFGLCEVSLPEPAIWTTVRPKLIRPYFNAGLVWVIGIKDFYQQWYKDFIKIIQSEFRPFGYQSRDGDDFRCLDQVALAVTASRYQDQLKILPETFNYPLPFRPVMKLRANHPGFNELVHVHYHKWFQHPDFLEHITAGIDQVSAQYRWLKQCLPLEPLIDTQFKI